MFHLTMSEIADVATFHLTTSEVYQDTLVSDDNFGKINHIGIYIGIYRLYWDTLVPDDNFGKMTIY